MNSQQNCPFHLRKGQLTSFQKSVSLDLHECVAFEVRGLCYGRAVLTSSLFPSETGSCLRQRSSGELWVMAEVARRRPGSGASRRLPERGEPAGAREKAFPCAARSRRARRGRVAGGPCRDAILRLGAGGGAGGSGYGSAFQRREGPRARRPSRAALRALPCLPVRATACRKELGLQLFLGIFVALFNSA